MSAVGIILTFTFVNNVVLGQLLGVCPILGLPRRPALRLGLMPAAAMPAAALASWAVRRLVLVPLGLESLQLIALCLVLALFVLLPAGGKAGWNLPVTNCAVLGVGLLTAGSGVLGSLVTGLAAGAGYLLAAVVFSGLRERSYVLPYAFASLTYNRVGFFDFETSEETSLTGMGQAFGAGVELPISKRSRIGAELRVVGANLDGAKTNFTSLSIAFISGGVRPAPR